MEELPSHIGIIMDGNRSWAKKQGLDPKLGHKKGAEVLENMVEYASKIGIKHFTVYAFSTENWKREKIEVDAIMKLLGIYINKFFKRADDLNIQVRLLGDMTPLEESLKKSLNKIIDKTSKNTGMVFNIALNYGGRDELIYAVKKIAKDVSEAKIRLGDIDEKLISENLYTAGQPDPDLIIRTSGQLRLSNFLTWQSTYSELYFTDKCWPAFEPQDLDEAILEYSRRVRKFGGK